MPRLSDMISSEGSEELTRRAYRFINNNHNNHKTYSGLYCSLRDTGLDRYTESDKRTEA